MNYPMSQSVTGGPAIDLNGQAPAIGDIVAVSWLDAWCDDTASPETFRESYAVETIGILLRDADVVSVAAERIQDGDYRAVTHIPRSLVKSVEVLRRA